MKIGIIMKFIKIMYIKLCKKNLVKFILLVIKQLFFDGIFSF